MKTVTIQFEVSDNISDKAIIHQLAISITLAQLNANSITIHQPIKNRTVTYDLQETRRDLRRFPQ